MSMAKNYTTALNGTGRIYTDLEMNWATLVEQRTALEAVEMLAQSASNTQDEERLINGVTHLQKRGRHKPTKRPLRCGGGAVVLAGRKQDFKNGIRYGRA